MANKKQFSLTLKAGGASASIWLRNLNTLQRSHDQANLLVWHNTRLLLCYGGKKLSDKGFAIRFDTIMAHSLYPRIFNKQQQKIFKEAFKKRKESLDVK